MLRTKMKGKVDFDELLAFVGAIDEQIMTAIKNRERVPYTLSEQTAYGFITLWKQEPITYTITEASAQLILSEPECNCLLLEEDLLRPCEKDVVYLDYSNSPSFVKYMKALGAFCVVLTFDGITRFNTVTRLKNGKLCLESTLCFPSADGYFIKDGGRRRFMIWNAFCNIMMQRKDEEVSNGNEN